MTVNRDNSQTGQVDLRLGDCLTLLPEIATDTVDLVIADLPYGTSYAAWDSVIALDRLWPELRRITKPNAPIVMTACQPFTSVLVTSNLAMFRHEWIWDKVNAANFANANREPLKRHESVLVFSRKAARYIPQKVLGAVNHSQGKAKAANREIIKISERAADDTSGLKFPKSIITFPKHSSQCKHHPTEKPVDLMRYLVRTYSDPGAIVLDPTMGSGSTGVAVVEEGADRRFIGIEKDGKHYDTAVRRVQSAALPQSAVFGGEGFTPDSATY